MLSRTYIVFSAALVFAVLEGCSTMTHRWTLAEGQHAQLLEKEVTKTVRTRFQLYLPKGYDQHGGAKWPLIVFLHGSGERGDDIELVKVHGPPKIVEKWPDFPFIVVSPQAPRDTFWADHTIDALLDELIERLSVDEERIYLTGLSLGGYGTWDIAAAYPERFAAIAPVCGGGHRQTACRLKNVPVWAFHGGSDPVVDVKESQTMVDAVNACGGDARLTIYPGVGHDSWTQTYADPALYDWFLRHRRVSAR